jgi:hypothetical protein
LRDDVEAQYEVTPVRGGIGLLPKDSDRGVSLIELRGDGVYLDGEGPFPAQRLAAELGPDAAFLLRLSYLDTAAQRAVLGLAPLTEAESAGTASTAEPTPLAEPTPPAEPAFPAVPVKAGFVGLLAQLLFLPLLVTAIVLLVITIIGIPLLVLVPVVLVGAMVLMVLGFTGVAQGVGQRFFGGGAGGWSVFVLFWLGLLLVMIPTLAGEALGLVPWLGIFAVMLGIVGFVVEYVAWTAGMGAVILNRFGGEPVAVAGAAPPPVPEVPHEAPPPDLPLTEPPSD